MHADSACTGNADSLQCHGATVSPTETPNVLDEIDRRIRVAWMSVKRYTRELYDPPKVSLLPLKARMVRYEVVVEALLHACTTWTPLNVLYNKLNTTHTGCCLES